MENPIKMDDLGAPLFLETPKLFSIERKKVFETPMWGFFCCDWKLLEKHWSIEENTSNFYGFRKHPHDKAVAEQKKNINVDQRSLSHVSVEVWYISSIEDWWLHANYYWEDERLTVTVGLLDDVLLRIFDSVKHQLFDCGSATNLGPSKLCKG